MEWWWDRGMHVGKPRKSFPYCPCCVRPKVKSDQKKRRMDVQVKGRMDGPWTDECRQINQIDLAGWWIAIKRDRDLFALDLCSYSDEKPSPPENPEWNGQRKIFILFSFSSADAETPPVLFSSNDQQGQQRCWLSRGTHTDYLPSRYTTKQTNQIHKHNLA